MRCAVFLLNGVCDKKTENRHQRTDIRRQKSESRYQRTDARRQRTEIRNQKTEIRNQISRLQAVSCLRVSDPRLPAVFYFPRRKYSGICLGMILYVSSAHD